MAAVAFVVHPDRPEAAQVAADTADWLLGLGHRVCLPTEDAVRVGRPELGVDETDLAEGLDVAVSLGGDGTILRTVALVARHDVPVLGVNFGQLGYLTDVEPEGIRPALERVLAGTHGIEERMLLDVEVVSRSGAIPDQHVLALNEDLEWPHDPPRCRSGRRSIHSLRRRRTHRRDTDRFHGLCLLGPRSHRRAHPPRVAAHAGVPPHAVRPHARARRRFRRAADGFG
jgi:hypothetical protein